MMQRQTGDTGDFEVEDSEGELSTLYAFVPLNKAFLVDYCSSNMHSVSHRMIWIMDMLLMSAILR